MAEVEAREIALPTEEEEALEDMELEAECGSRGGEGEENGKRGGEEEEEREEGQGNRPRTEAEVEKSVEEERLTKEGEEEEEEREEGQGKRPRTEAEVEKSVEEERLTKEGEEEEEREEGQGKRPRTEAEVEKSVEEERLTKEEEEEVKEEKVRLGPKEFGSAVDMFDYFFKFLHSWSPNIDVNEYEHMVLLDLLKKGHLEPDKKIGDGIQAFQVRFHPLWKSRCFFLVHVDGSSDDFSFRKCVDHILPLPENMKPPSISDGKKSGGHQKGGGQGGRGGHGGKGRRGGRGGRGRGKRGG